MKIETLLQRLEAEQVRLATEALRQPAGKDAFEYGRAAGIFAGLEQAKRVLIDLVAERDKKDFIL